MVSRALDFRQYWLPVTGNIDTGDRTGDTDTVNYGTDNGTDDTVPLVH